MKIIQKILLTVAIITLYSSANTIETKETNNSLIQIETNKHLKEAFQHQRTALLKSIPHKKFLKRFYKRNHYQPLWISNNQLNKNRYNTLFKQINKDITLSPKGALLKNAQQLQKLFDDNSTNELKILRRELKLTALYYDFLSHTIYGEIQWKKFAYKLKALKKSRINGAWVKTKPPYSISKLLLQNDINQTIQEITPKHFGYAKLLKALNKLKRLKKSGGWEKLPPFKKLTLGSTGEIVKRLRTRLEKSGDYQTCEESNTSTILKNVDENQTLNKDEIALEKEAIFGTCLDRAVKKFQKRHGLAVDGVVGKGTRKALNISVDEKIRKVLLNIDRIKWLPREELDRYIVVNIPEFMLHYIENNQSKQNLRVIVGNPRHPTPIFNQYISYIVLNPYWKVPEGIVRREIVPHMIKDPSYLRKQGIEAHRTWNENSRVIDVSWLYWEDYRYEKFPYRLMQPPGPKNALGKIKFKFPNRFSVYLHDTPTRHLFKKSFRAYSHGCVRLSSPKKLLETIATFNKNINIKRAKKILRGKRKTQLNMSEKLRIYLVYLTAGVNDNGDLEFRDDLYHYDKYQKRILR